MIGTVYRTIKDGFYFRVGKRCFDTAVASTALVLLAPLFLLTALAIKLTSRGPVFFRQLRVGQLGTPFRIFKFRTMRTMAGTNGGTGSSLTAAGDPRITTLGRCLRRTKIDELPQLINVVCGDMSLVGPRPEVPEYVTRYSERQRQVLRVKPGITGPAANDFIDEELLLAGQPNKEAFYLNTILPAKLDYDIAYSNRVRFRGDLRIILETLSKVCNRFVVPPGQPLQSPDSRG